MLHWILFIAALATLLASFFGDSVDEILLLWALAFALAFGGGMAFYQSRLRSGSSPTALMVDPDTLKRLRAQAKARREADSDTPTPPSAPPP